MFVELLQFVHTSGWIP